MVVVVVPPQRVLTTCFPSFGTPFATRRFPLARTRRNGRAVAVGQDTAQALPDRLADRESHGMPQADLPPSALTGQASPAKESREAGKVCQPQVAYEIN